MKIQRQEKREKHQHQVEKSMSQIQESCSEEKRSSLRHALLEKTVEEEVYDMEERQKEREMETARYT